jgi:3-oxoadipate enol-lactonase
MITREPEDRTLTIGNRLVRCRVEGQPDAPAIVFSNSLCTNLSLWDAEAERFRQSFHIVRYDQEGHGGTAVTRQASTFEDFSTDVVALLDALHIARAALVGVSMGGVTAILTAVRHPDRVSAIVACSARWCAAPGARDTWQSRIHVAQTLGMQALVEPTVERWFMPATLSTRQGVVNHVRRMIAATPAAGFVGAARALQSFDFTAECRTLQVPALLVAGEADGDLPIVTRQMHEAMPGSAALELTNAGHLPHLEAPERFSKALNAFLSETVA